MPTCPAGRAGPASGPAGDALPLLSDEGQRWSRRGLLAAPFLSSRAWPSGDARTLSARHTEAAGTGGAGCALARTGAVCGRAGLKGGREAAVTVAPEDSAAARPRGPSLRLSSLCGERDNQTRFDPAGRGQLGRLWWFRFHSTRATDAKRWCRHIGRESQGTL